MTWWIFLFGEDAAFPVAIPSGNGYYPFQPLLPTEAAFTPADADIAAEEPPVRPA